MDTHESHWIIQGIEMPEDQVIYVRHKDILELPGQLMPRIHQVNEEISIFLRAHLSDVLSPHHTLSVEELILNAVHHGNDKKVNRSVRVSIRIYRDSHETYEQVRWVISCEDEGKAFFDPQSRIQLAKEHADRMAAALAAGEYYDLPNTGRGLLILQSFVGDVSCLATLGGTQIRVAGRKEMKIQKKEVGTIVSMPGLSIESPQTV